MKRRILTVLWRIVIFCCCFIVSLWLTNSVFYWFLKTCLRTRKITTISNNCRHVNVCFTWGRYTWTRLRSTWWRADPSRSWRRLCTWSSCPTAPCCSCSADRSSCLTIIVSKLGRFAKSFTNFNSNLTYFKSFANSYLKT